MARKKRITTSIRRAEAAPTASLETIRGDLKALEGCFTAARRHGFRVASHNYYRREASDRLASVRKELLLLRAGVSALVSDGVSPILADIQSKIAALDVLGEPSAQLVCISEIRATVNSDLAAALEGEASGSAVPFLPTEIVPNGVYRKILAEANACFGIGGYNACAAMLRRLIESLIIEAFETKGIEAKIKVDGDYCELKALIGKAAPELNLGRNSREALPKLKFFGDLSVHSRRHLIRKADLERLHSDVRVAIEELATHLRSSLPTQE